MKTIIKLVIALVLLQTTNAQNTLNEGFESWPPENWDFYRFGAQNDGWRDTFDLIANTGIIAAYASISSNQCDHWMVTPAVTIDNGNYELKFWEYSSPIDVSFYDSAKVYVSSASNDPTSGDFIEVFETQLNTNNWEQRTIDLSAYAGQTIYVGFRYEGTFHRWYIDDVTVSPDNFTDGRLLDVTNPTGVVETPQIFPVLVSFENTGTTNVDDFIIEWDVNGVPQSDASFTNMLILPGQSQSLLLDNYDFSAEGFYEISATLVLANDFDSSNNTTESVFEISSFKDAAIKSVSPEGMVPNSGIQNISVTLENQDQNTINDVEINWEVDGVSQTPVMVNGLNLAFDESVDIDLGPFNFNDGLHTITATLNVLGDVNEANDTYTSNIAVNTFYESFEGAQFPPEGWSINFGVRESSNFGTPYDGSFYYSAQVDDNYFGVVNDLLVTPLLDIENGDQFSFYIQSEIAFQATVELIWIDGITGQENLIATVPPTAGGANWELRTYDISAATGINKIGIRVSPQGSYGQVEFDLFTSDASLYLYDNDLKIRNGDIYFLARQNVSQQYSCKIRNTGNLPVSGSDYTVRLMQEPSTVLATASGVDLASWEETTLTIDYTSPNIGNERLYFEIDYSMDQNPSDNTFRSYLVGTVPSSAVINEPVSRGGRDGNIPFTANGNTNSLGEDDLTQSVFLENEFNDTGYVYGIAYEYDNLLNADVVKDYPLKVWITQSDIANMDNGWVPTDEMVLVFDGKVDILPGNSRDIYIPFNQPVLLNGIDNVVIQNYQYDPTWPPAIFRTYISDFAPGSPNRSIGVLDVFNLDPASAPEFFISFKDVPYTRFVVDPVADTSVLSGTVFDIDTNTPLPNVTITIPNTSITVTTDASGNYTLPGLPYGDYTFNQNAGGYQDNSDMVTLNLPNQTQDFFMSALVQLQLTGQVFGSNDVSTPLEFVDVVITDQDGNTVTDSTDANGNFSSAIFGTYTYGITLNLYGYLEQNITISPIDLNVDLSNIVLVEEFISPFDLVADDANEVELIWKNPKLSSKVKFQQDNGVISASYTNEPNENVWLGNYFNFTELTTITSVEIQTDVFPNASDFVTVEVWDYADDELLATSEPFIISEDEVQTIDIPNIVVSGFITIMVHWQNNPASTNALAVDFSDPNLTDAAVIKFPGQQATLFSSFLGGGSPPLAFHVRANTLKDGNPVTNGLPVSYNVYRGLASEFPDTTNWIQLNASPITDLTLVDTNTSNVIPTEFYRYAVETIYDEGVSEVTFSNEIEGQFLLSVADLNTLIPQLILYPNPVDDMLSLIVDGYHQIDEDIHIYDMFGKLVMRVEQNDKNSLANIDVSALSDGIYIMKVTVNGTDINKKFIKQ